MENPFESGHIKNYILFYSSIVVIMVLFFIASTLLHDVQEVEKKVFSTELKEVEKPDLVTQEADKLQPKFKLLEVNTGSYNQHY